MLSIEYGLYCLYDWLIDSNLDRRYGGGLGLFACHKSVGAV